MVRIVTFLVVWLMASAGWGVAAPYTDHGNGTVTDATSGLMWQKSDDNKTRTWQDALDYCNGLTLADYHDWRLPNIKELASLVDTYYAPTIDPIFACSESVYWASTSDENDSVRAWHVYFLNGNASSSPKTYDNHVVRCVR